MNAIGFTTYTVPILVNYVSNSIVFSYVEGIDTAQLRTYLLEIW